MMKNNGKTKAKMESSMESIWRIEIEWPEIDFNWDLSGIEWPEVDFDWETDENLLGTNNNIVNDVKDQKNFKKQKTNNTITGEKQVLKKKKDS